MIVCICGLGLGLGIGLGLGLGLGLGCSSIMNPCTLLLDPRSSPAVFFASLRSASLEGTDSNQTCSETAQGLLNPASSTSEDFRTAFGDK